MFSDYEPTKIGIGASLSGDTPEFAFTWPVRLRLPRDNYCTLTSSLRPKQLNHVVYIGGS
jgi:hypothetical protein